MIRIFIFTGLLYSNVAWGVPFAMNCKVLSVNDELQPHVLSYVDFSTPLISYTHQGTTFTVLDEKGLHVGGKTYPVIYTERVPLGAMFEDSALGIYGLLGFDYYESTGRGNGLFVLEFGGERIKYSFENCTAE